MNEIRIASVAHPYRLFQRRPDLNHNQLDVARRFGATMGVNAAGGDAVVGIHGVKADLHLERFWSPKHRVHYEVCRRRRHAGAAQTVQSKKLDPKRLITHGLKLDLILDAYDTFSRAADTRAVKSIIEAMCSRNPGTGCARIEIIGVRLELRSALNRLVPEDRTLAPPPSTRSAMEWCS
jgi:hypothetical protein